MEPPLANPEYTLSRAQIKKLLLSESDRESLEPADGERAMITNSYTINGRRVFFVGSSHIFNAPEEERPRLSNELSSSIREFQQQTEGKKSAVYIIEGSIPKRENRDQMQDYESVRLIQEVEASNPEAVVISGEPLKTEILQDLKSSKEGAEFNTNIEIDSLGKFNKSDLSLLYFYFRGGVLKNPEAKVRIVAEVVSNSENFSFFDTSEIKQQLDLAAQGKVDKETFINNCLNSNIFNQLEAAYDYLRSKYPDEEDAVLFGPTDPTNTENFNESLKRGISSIAVSVNRYRDAHLLEQVQSQTKSGKDVFVLYGRSHQIRTKKAMEALSQEN